MLKKLLAEELTKRVHSVDAYESVLQVSEILFNKKASNEYLKGLSLEALETISAEVASFELSKAALDSGIDIVEVLCEKTDILSSKGESKRAIKNNAISINKVKVSSDDITISPDNLIKEKYIMIENGKKNKYIFLIVFLR